MGFRRGDVDSAIVEIVVVVLGVERRKGVDTQGQKPAGESEVVEEWLGKFSSLSKLVADEYICRI